MTSVDLNSDLGEGFGSYVCGDDAAMLGLVSSANVACGFHAGDPEIMAATFRLAKENGVAVGAHPGFPDLWGFGRRRIPFSPSEIDESCFDGVGLVYIEGYLLFNMPLFDALLSIASRKGIPVALDCGSFEVVGIFRDRLLELLGSRAISILLANEDESKALTNTDPEPSLEWIAQHVDTVAVKLGARGALLAQGQRRAIVQAVPVPQVVDTTGAGDLWAAGFLAGLDQGLDLAASGHLAATVAAEAIQVLGAQIPPESWRRLGVA